MTLRILFHLSPLTALYLGHWYLFGAMVCGICLPYIKCLKFEAEIASARIRLEAIDDIDNLRLRWQKLTFLEEYRNWQRGRIETNTGKSPKKSSSDSPDNKRD
jgi:hypothetical protein